MVIICKSIQPCSVQGGLYQTKFYEYVLGAETVSLDKVGFQPSTKEVSKKMLFTPLTSDFDPLVILSAQNAATACFVNCLAFLGQCDT
jgi:hypothetical protein